MSESMIVKAKIKDYAKVNEKPLNVAGDFYPKLAEKVEAMIKEASIRAKANGGNTVMAKDL